MSCPQRHDIVLMAPGFERQELVRDAQVSAFRKPPLNNGATIILKETTKWPHSQIFTADP